MLLSEYSLVPCGCVCMTRLLLFRLLSAWAVFLRVIIYALEQSLIQGSHPMKCEVLWNVCEVSKKKKEKMSAVIDITLRSCLNTFSHLCKLFDIILPNLKTTWKKILFSAEWFDMMKNAWNHNINSVFLFPADREKAEIIECVSNTVKLD